jgi:hypothetical protein
VTRPARRDPGGNPLADRGIAPPGHRCPVPGCTRHARAGQLMCRPHWAALPGAFRGAVLAAWQGGDGAGTPAHAAATAAAIAAVQAWQDGAR